MANKKSTKKKAQQKTEPSAAASNQASKPVSKKAVAKAAPKKETAPVKKVDKAKKTAKPGPFKRLSAYLKSVRSEMKRVVWPTRKELINYSVAVCASLIVVGVVIALLDLVIGEGLVLFSGLRG